MAGRDRRRRAAALLVSLLIHTALLAPLLLVAPKFQTTQTPNPATMRLGLVPAPTLGITTHRTTPGRPATSQRVRAQPLAQPASRPQDQVASRASAPAASAPHTPPSAAAISASANTEAPTAGNQDAVRRALRTALACAPSNTQNLDE